MENTSSAVRALLPNGIEVRVEASQSPGSHDRDVVESADKVFELHAVQTCPRVTFPHAPVLSLPHPPHPVLPRVLIYHISRLPASM